MSLWLQYTVIAMVVLTSAAVVWKKQFPASWRRMRTALALPLLRSPNAGMQRLGRWLAPPAMGGASSCGGCDGCGPDPRKP